MDVSLSVSRAITNDLELFSHNEDYNRKATKYIRKNANVKGQPNLTIGMYKKL